MALYTYKAISADGRRLLGRIDALNLVDLEMRLKRMELDLVTGEPISNRSLLGGTGVPRREIIHFCFHLELLVRAGVPILDGLADLRDTIENPRFREVVAGLIEATFAAAEGDSNDDEIEVLQAARDRLAALIDYIPAHERDWTPIDAA